MPTNISDKNKPSSEIIRGATLLILVALWLLSLKSDNWSPVLLIFMSSIFTAISIKNRLVAKRVVKQKLEQTVVVKGRLFNYYQVAIAALILNLYQTFQVDNLVAVISVTIITVGIILFLIPTQGTVYLFNKYGIHTVNSDQKILLSTITEIEETTDTIAFHTSKYRNDLKIERSKLRSPSWEELLERMVEMRLQLDKDNSASQITATNG